MRIVKNGSDADIEIGKAAGSNIGQCVYELWAMLVITVNKH